MLEFLSPDKDQVGASCVGGNSGNSSGVLLTFMQVGCNHISMRYALSDDLGGDRLPKVGGWVFLVVLPVVVAFSLVVVVVPLGSVGRRVLSIVSQIASARSELLPILIGSQLGVSALVVAVTQFQPGRWRGTPKELGRCWLSEVRLVASQENRCKAASLGLACISSIVVFGVAACIYQNPDAGGIMLLAVVWGVHAVSCIVLIMVPMAGVAAIADYWGSLTRLAYVAEMWPEYLREARGEAEVGRPSLICRLRRWRIVVVLLFLGLAMFVVAFVEKYCSGTHSGLGRQCIVGCVAVLAILESIVAGYWRWRGGIVLSALLFWLSVPLVLAQGLLMEFESIIVATISSSWRSLGFGSAATVTLVFLVLLWVVASGSQSVWERFDCFKSILVSAWVYELRFQRRCGIKCSPSERKAVEESFVKLAKKRKKGLVKSVKESVLLPFVAR